MRIAGPGMVEGPDDPSLKEAFRGHRLARLSRRAQGGDRLPPGPYLVEDFPEPGLVARSPGCAEVVLRLVRGLGTAWLDLRGAVSLRVSLPD
ncbi:DUF6510 family protein [Nonomuraea sp. SYSU D8015]|uniref:DUF6510 family protein n=1 Tax=Nonomuraea sp. SYSU D8015 TaxID=2593644 RepID=UPI001660C485|nr:DUF6510 family protein [Nonomuraea sp. SYSU D8015]